jgi:cell division protein FtsA
MERRLPSVIGVGTAPTSGMRKGVVVDVEETVSSITAAVDEAERISGVAIDRATISIDGAHVASQNSKGVIAVGRADQEIMVDDLVRVEEAATAIQMQPNREILQVFPRSYSVDGQTNIKDPVGMHGVRLEVESHIITGSIPAIKDLDRSIHQAGIAIQGQVLVP